MPSVNPNASVLVTTARRSVVEDRTTSVPFVHNFNKPLFSSDEERDAFPKDLDELEDRDQFLDYQEELVETKIANTSECEFEFLTAVGTVSYLTDHAATSSPPYFSAPMTIEQGIEDSMSHWSEVVDSDSNEVQVPAEISNRGVFETLQDHPKWGNFFRTFDKKDLIMGDKIAEGGQAEIYDVQVLRKSKFTQRSSTMVLKVFKKGFYLQELQSQWPPGMLHRLAEINKYVEGAGGSTFYAPELLMGGNAVELRGGTLLDDGRFAFLMQKHEWDLRSLIDHRMKEIRRQDPGPFSVERATELMYKIANGMMELHKHNIVHRDLKASNVLISEKMGHHEYCTVVADYECSVGVVGTGFFRAPEILQACKEKNVSNRPELFTKEADVYSYGMTCYEILTGKLPFQGHSTREYDLVLSGQRPDVPDYVEDWMRGLLHRCWQPNTTDRPSFATIVLEFGKNCGPVRPNCCQLRLTAAKSYVEQSLTVRI